MTESRETYIDRENVHYFPTIKIWGSSDVANTLLGWPPVGWDPPTPPVPSRKSSFPQFQLEINRETVTEISTASNNTSPKTTCRHTWRATEIQDMILGPAQPGRGFPVGITQELVNSPVTVNQFQFLSSFYERWTVKSSTVNQGFMWSLDPWARCGFPSSCFKGENSFRKA